MHPKLDDALRRQLDKARHGHAHLQIPVIVTVAPGTDTAELERHGLKVYRIIDSPHAVCGTIEANRVAALAALDQVQALAHDGEARIL